MRPQTFIDHTTAMPPPIVPSSSADRGVQFLAKMKARGNACDLITIPGGGHGMGGWEKLNSDYAARMIE
jgi:acetyl esterase/lipase